MYIQFIISFAVYLTIVLAIGLVAARAAASKNKHSPDFLLGGRSTHWFLTALSAHAADMSDWLFMGLPAAIYLQGGYQIWIPIGLLVGMFCVWHFIAKRLRISSAYYRGVTLASYFQERFNDRSGIIIVICALISCFFFSIYLSVGLKGIGYVLKSAFNLDYHLGTLFAVLVVLTYTVLGGFISVAWIDLFQGIFLLIMLMIVPIVGFFSVGGFSAIFNAAQQKAISLSLIPDFSLHTMLSILLNPFAWCLGYFGMPHVLTKFMGTENAEDLHKAKYVGITWQLLATSAAVGVGLVGIAYFMQGVPGKPEFIFIEMTKQLFNPWFAGIVLCAILAATISTVDSQLLVLASIIAHDFYKNIFCKRATQKQVMWVYRASLIVTACIGYAIAWDEHSTIMSLVKYAWSGLGASFGPLMILSLYSTSINKYGAIAGILAGAFVAATWDLINPYVTSMPVYSIVPGFIIGLITIYTVSLATKE